VNLDRFVYVFFIIGNKVHLIDSGVAAAEPIIFRYLQDLGREPDHISKLVLTHSHPDHVGAARLIKAKTNCEVYAPLHEMEWVEDTEKQNHERPVPGFHILVSGPVRVDHTVMNRDTILLEAGLELEAIHTPGHSRGSTSYLLRSENALFTGDAIPIAGDIPIYEDYSASLTSVQKLNTMYAVDYLFSSWDEPRRGKECYTVMDKSVEYLERIHEIVRVQYLRNPLIDPTALCIVGAGELGFPPAAVNPLLSRTFAATLETVRKEQG
jgi:glyoxylase-like metal-dependent hydrolase (beta-lactamase superfamily II)